MTQSEKISKSAKANKNRPWEIRKFLKIAEEVLGDTNACIEDLGMASPEPRSFLPLIQQAKKKAIRLIEGGDSGEPVKNSFNQTPEEDSLNRIFLELQYVEGMLKMLPKAPSPFTDLQVM